MAINKEIAEKLWFDGLTDSEIAKILNCNTKKIRDWRFYYKLPSNRGIFDWKKGEKCGNNLAK